MTDFAPRMAVRRLIELSVGAALFVALGSCVAGGGGQSAGSGPTPIATNTVAVKDCIDNWVPETVRVRHSTSERSLLVGEYLACDQLKNQLRNRSLEVCEQQFGYDASIRNLTADTQFDGAGFVCDCREELDFLRCSVEGDAICAFERGTSSQPDCL